MDEMRIKSAFLTNIIARIIERLIKEKFGYEMKMAIEEINASCKDGKCVAGVNLRVYMSENELKRLMRNNNLPG